MAVPLIPSLPLSTALRDSLKDYSLKAFRDDALAGLIVSLIALPLSMVLAIAVGLPPRHGLYTAVVAGIAGAVFGGSRTQVSGPTAAFVVIVAPVVAQYGLSGIVWCQIIAGGLLLALGFLRAGRLIHYVPHAVVTGFTAGIAVTIGTLALNDLLGLRLEGLKGHYIEKVSAIVARLPVYHPADLAVGLVTLGIIIVFPRLTARIPSPAVGIAGGALLAYALSKMGIGVDTLDTRFSYTGADGVLHTGVPPFPPSFSLPAKLSSGQLLDILPHAFMIAALAALESLLSARVADSLTHTHHDPDAELSGIGAANILSGLASGIPATGAIARTATNIHAGAKTPVAAVIHALLILLYMVTLAPFISMIPMAALAALLMITAWRMSHVRQFAGILKLGSGREIAVLLVSFLLTVFIDMVAGVGAGLLLGFVLLRGAPQGSNTVTQ